MAARAAERRPRRIARVGPSPCPAARGRAPAEDGACTGPLAGAARRRRPIHCRLGERPPARQPLGGDARTSGTPKRTERPAGLMARPAVPVRAATVRPERVVIGRMGADLLRRLRRRFTRQPEWSNGFGWGQSTRSDYGWCDAANNVVSGGFLAQRIDHRPKGGQPFSVGCIHSKNKFAQEFGYWEARIQRRPLLRRADGVLGQAQRRVVAARDRRRRGQRRRTRPGRAGPSSPPTGSETGATSRTRLSSPGPTSPTTTTRLRRRVDAPKG